MQITLVVAGIVERNERVLLAQRPEGKNHGLLWEFPGGKVEPGETSHEALIRELKEELDLVVVVGPLFAQRAGEANGRTLIIEYYRASPCGSEARAVECRDFAWVLPAEMAMYPLSPLDAEVARDYRVFGK